MNCSIIVQEFHKLWWTMHVDPAPELLDKMSILRPKISRAQILSDQMPKETCRVGNLVLKIYFLHLIPCFKSQDGCLKSLGFCLKDHLVAAAPREKMRQPSSIAARGPVHLEIIDIMMTF